MAAHIVGRVPDGGGHVDGRHAQVDRVGVHQREVDDVLDGLAEQLHRDVDVTNDLELGLVIPLAPGDIEQLDLPLNCEHRRAQLVLRGVEKVALQLVQLAQPADRLTLLFQRAGVLDRNRGVVGERDQRALVALGHRARRTDDEDAGQHLLEEHRDGDGGATAPVETDRVTGAQLVHRHCLGQVGHLWSAPAHPEELRSTSRVDRRTRGAARNRVGCAEHSVLELFDAARRHRQCPGHLLQPANRSVDVLDVPGDLLAHAVDPGGEATELIARSHRDVGGVVTGGDPLDTSLQPRHRAADELIDEQEHQQAHDHERRECDLRDGSLILRRPRGEDREGHLDAEVPGDLCSSRRHQPDEAPRNRAGAGDRVDGACGDAAGRRCRMRHLLGNRRGRHRWCRRLCAAVETDELRSGAGADEHGRVADDRTVSGELRLQLRAVHHDPERRPRVYLHVVDGHGHIEGGQAADHFDSLDTRGALRSQSRAHRDRCARLLTG